MKSLRRWLRAFLGIDTHEARLKHLESVLMHEGVPRLEEKKRRVSPALIRKRKMRMLRAVPLTEEEKEDWASGV